MLMFDHDLMQVMQTPKQCRALILSQHIGLRHIRQLVCLSEDNRHAGLHIIQLPCICMEERQSRWLRNGGQQVLTLDVTSNVVQIVWITSWLLKPCTVCFNIPSKYSTLISTGLQPVRRGSCSVRMIVL